MSDDARRHERDNPPEGARRREPEKLPDDQLDAIIRQALFELEVPEPKPDFDEKVLAAVRGRSPWWDLFLSYLRPALATASAAAVVTLLLVHWATHPVHPVAAADAPLTARATIAGEARLRRALESPDPTYAAIAPIKEARKAALRSEEPHRETRPPALRPAAPDRPDDEGIGDDNAR